MTINVPQSRFGKTEPYDLQVAAGVIPNARAIFRSAYSNVLASPSTYMVWNLARSYTFPAAATVMTLSSSSASDTAQLVLVQGLDSGYNEISEIVALNGQNAVSTTKAYKRINDLIVVVDGAVGNIYIGTGTVTAGVPANIYNFIYAGDNMSHTAVYTVPAGHTLYIKGGSLSSFTVNANKQVTVNYYSQMNGVRYLSAGIIAISGYQHYPYDPPAAIPEKTDIFDFATTTDSSSSVVVNLSAILLKNETI